MRTGNRHLFRLIAIAFVALAAAVPAAQAAGPSSDDRAVSRSTSAALAPATISPDDRGYYRGASAALAPKSVSPDDRAFARSVPGIEPTTIAAMVVTPQGGFDWTDAIVGATLGLGLALLGAGAVLIGVRHRSSLKTA